MDFDIANSAHSEDATRFEETLTQSSAYSQNMQYISAQNPTRDHADKSDSHESVSQETRPEATFLNDENISTETQFKLVSIPPEILRGKYSTFPGEKPKPGLDRTLPPISKVEKIFDDLATKAQSNGFDNFLQHIGSRKLRVATMCSGTESPLLALEMFQDSFERLYGKSFRVHHLFSAEIDPFKQSYIQRNFAPDIIFRDVNELVAEEATTAFGSMRMVPTDPDLLVVGFSCVDFSNLNLHRRALEEMGESGHTFYGVVRYMQRCRPPLAILENVCGAPWDHIKQILDEIDYNAYHVKIDTKSYYLPQTRERGYMLCIDQTRLITEPVDDSKTKSKSLFARMMKTLERPASSPATQFLLKNDDPRLWDAVNDISANTSKDRQTVDWTRYKARHLGYRMREGLGDKRPLTRWQDSGTCQMPDFYWHGWSRTQTERVWDTLDVNYLRTIVRGYDINYKSRIIDVSQGLDRELDQRASGVSGCLTPRGQHFITSRGGPLLGIEALALQGIPIDRLLLGNDSQRDLHDLAGNAMSSTVVGAAIASALIIGHQALSSGPTGYHESDVSESTSPSISVVQGHRMSQLPIDIAGDDSLSTTEIHRQALRSARLCSCEGHIGTRTRSILLCVRCGHTSCSKCGQNPTHEYERIYIEERIPPIKFEIELKTKLPMRLYLSGLSFDVFEQPRGATMSVEVNAAWNNYLRAVQSIPGDQFKFQTLNRQRWWNIIYVGENSVLTLTCTSTRTQWALLGIPCKNEPSNSPLRQILAHPVARMVPEGTSLLKGVWHVSSPISSQFDLVIQGRGEMVESLAAKAGLQRPIFRDSKVFSILNVSGRDEDIEYLEVDIRGDYELLQNCGGASGSLHRQITSNTNPVYLFLNPTEVGPPQLDSWVFAFEHDRLDIGQTRDTIAEIRPNWSPFHLGQTPETVKCWYRKWTPCSQISLEVYCPSTPAVYEIPDPNNIASMYKVSCERFYIPMLHCAVPGSGLDLVQTPGFWKEANLVEDPEMLQQSSWLLQRATGITNFQEWRSFEFLENDIQISCLTCAPHKPRLKWALDEKDRVYPYENPVDAAAYEKSVKSRPPAFLGFTLLDQESVTHLWICLNVLSLLHQAVGRLVRPRDISLQWRLCIDTTGFVRRSLPRLMERNNKLDIPSAQPPNFRYYELRPEQLRSLSWMIGQESHEALPFEEQEVVEAVLPAINWRAEGRASTNKVVRGGILGDEVGYGKTAITLGLIDVQFQKCPYILPDTFRGSIPVKGTLVVVPHHLFDQWKTEIRKFLGDAYKILEIRTNSSRNFNTIGEFQSADIVLASASLLRGTSYYGAMEQFAAAPDVPKVEGRIFDEWLDDAMANLREQVDRLVSSGPSAVLESILSRKPQLSQGGALSKYKPSKRLKGQKFREHLLKMKQEAANRDGKEMLAEENFSQAAISTSTPAFTDRGEGLNGSKRKRVVSDDEASENTGHRLANEQGPNQAKKKAKPDVKNSDIDPETLFNLHESVKDWTQIRAPILHMFEFGRIVIDEFTYSKDRNYSAALTIPARTKWILSGTPPLNNFADVKSFSPFLDVNLGIDENHSRRVENERLRAIQRERTDAEQFQPFVTRNSAAWHQRRHEVAQGFLDQFMRKNVPDIDEIPWTEHIVDVVLSPAERALYLELFMQLMSQNLRLRRHGRGLYDSVEISRLNAIIGNSSGPEEALSKRCSLFTVADISDTNADTILNIDTESVGANDKDNPLIAVRRDQLKSLGSDIWSRLKQGIWLRSKTIGSLVHFDSLLDSIEGHRFGDRLVTTEIQILVHRAKGSASLEDGSEFYRSPQEKKGAPGDARAEHPKTQTEFMSDLNQCTDTLRRLIYETVTRARALRLYQAVCSFQKSTIDSSFFCFICQMQKPDPRSFYILGECGHTSCKQCLEKCKTQERCLLPGCGGTVQMYRIINWGDLGREEPRENDGSFIKYGGTKFTEVISLLQDTDRIPPDDQVLLFIQFTELIDAASAALTSADIPHVTIYPGDRTPASKITAFQTGTEAARSKVLILNLGDVTASGLNMQNINHVIFFAPLIARSQYDYNSGMAQAIGRSRRYGQLKHVHIYHILALNTVEVNIFEQRRRQRLVKRGACFVAVPKNEILDTDITEWRGFPLEGSNAESYEDDYDGAGE